MIHPSWESEISGSQTDLVMVGPLPRLSVAPVLEFLPQLDVVLSGNLPSVLTKTVADENSVDIPVVPPTTSNQL